MRLSLPCCNRNPEDQSLVLLPPIYIVSQSCALIKDHTIGEEYMKRKQTEERGREGRRGEERGGERGGKREERR